MCRLILKKMYRIILYRVTIFSCPGYIIRVTMQVTLNHRSFHFKNRNSSLLFQFLADKFLRNITLQILFSAKAHIPKEYILHTIKKHFRWLRNEWYVYVNCPAFRTDTIVAFALKRVQVTTLFRYCMAGQPFQRRNNNGNTHNFTWKSRVFFICLSSKAFSKTQRFANWIRLRLQMKEGEPYSVGSS
jgi:hypothetical protein